MKVMATGAFDLLHPGHGLYLEKIQLLRRKREFLLLMRIKD